MWYAQKNYNDLMGRNPRWTIAEIGCFLTSFCNLLKRFGTEVDPASLNRLFINRGIYLHDPDGPDDWLGYASITAYDGNFHISNHGSGWPPTGDAIVKFIYRNRSGNTVTHFCLVDNAATHTIVDSWDGVVKNSPYGEPVEWYSYAGMTPQPITPVGAPAPGPNDYVIKSGDTLSGIAMRYKIDYIAIAEHNNIAPPYIIYPGQVIHIPKSITPPKVDDGIKYDLLKPAKQMHVSKSGGAEKWAFGNIKKWTDFISTAHVPENTNFEAVAIATVPIGDDFAGYYMDKLALGDYESNGGKVANTVGFSHADVADGVIIETPAPTPAPEPAPAVVPEPAPVEPAPVVAVVESPDPTTPVSQLEPVKATMTGPNVWKSTFTPMHANLYEVKETMMVHDLDGNRPDKKIIAGQSYDIGGTFLKVNEAGKSVLYGRPALAIPNGLWYGIPMSNLRSEDELIKETLAQANASKVRELSGHERIVNDIGKIRAIWLAVSSLFKIKKQG